MPLNLLLDDNQPTKKELRYGSILADQNRPSIAYDPMGVQANTGVIRKWNPGLKGGELNIGGTIVTDMVFVEESSVNICPTDAAEWEQGTISTLDGSTVGSSVTIRTVNYIAVNAANSYYLSCKNLTASAVNSIRVYQYDAGNVLLGIFQTSESVAGVLAITPLNASCVKIKIRLAKDGVTIMAPADITAIQPMLEAKPFATTYMPYNTTRAADSLSLTLPRPLKKEFTIVGAFAPNWTGDTKGKPGTYYEMFFNLRNSLTTNMYYLRNATGDSGKNDIANVSYDGITVKAVTVNNVIANTTYLKIHTFVFGFKNGIGRLWIFPNNGIMQKTEGELLNLQGLITTLWLGRHNSDGYESDAYNLPLLIIENWGCTNDTRAQTLADGLKQELVTNGDFSLGSTGWTLHANASVSNGELVLNATAATQQSITAVANAIPVLPNNVYTLSGEIYASTNQGSINLAYYDVNKNYIGTVTNSTINNNTPAYVRSLVNPTMPEGAYYVRLIIQSNGAGTFKFDNISLKLK